MTTVNYHRKVTVNKDGSYSIGEKCLVTDKPHYQPKIINNAGLKAYMPFNHVRTRNLGVETAFGKIKLKDFVLRSGQVYDSVEACD